MINILNKIINITKTSGITIGQALKNINAN